MHPLLKEILSHNSYRKYAYDLAGQDSEDLYQEMMLALLEKSDEKLTEIHQSGGQRFYVMQMMWHMYLGKYQLWDKQYRDKLQRIDWEKFILIEPIFEDTMPEAIQKEKELATMPEALDELLFFEDKIFQMYIDFGSQKKMSDVTQIPYNTIRQLLRQVREKLSQSIKEKAERYECRELDDL